MRTITGVRARLARGITLAPDPDMHVARRLADLGQPASGAVLEAARHLEAQGQEITNEALADALHEGVR